MKKSIISFLILLLWVTPSLAEMHHSQFGFSINIPSHWLTLSAEEMKENPELFDFENEMFKNTDKAILEQIRNRVASGNMEAYFNQRTADNYFTDNINVSKAVGRLPQNASESKKLCESYPNLFSTAYGKPIKVYSCGSKKVSGLNAFYVEFDGLGDGTRSMTCEIQRSQNVFIVLTATCKNGTLPIIKKEFEEICASIKME